MAYREYSVGGGAQSRGAVVLACGRDAGEAGGVEEEEKEVLLHKVTGTRYRGDYQSTTTSYFTGALA